MTEIQDALQEAVVQLAEARDKADVAKKLLTVFKHTNDELILLDGNRKEAMSALTEIEASLRSLAQDIYDETGEHQPHPAVTIKKYGSFEYDKELVTPWVKLNMPALMTVDWKAFNSYLKTAVNPVPGVVATATFKPTIKSDLSEYIPNE